MEVTGLRTYAIYRNGRASNVQLTPEAAPAWPGTPLLSAAQQINMDEPAMVTVVHMDGDEIDLGLYGE
jgi:hypothetical protein